MTEHTVWQYEPALQSTEGLSISERYGHYINGKHLLNDDAETIAVINPATGKQISTIEAGTKSVVNEAVQAAKEAYQEWKSLSGYERGRYIYAIGKLLQERKKEFAILETIDNGKPISETMNVDVPSAAQHFIYYAGWADKLRYAYPGVENEPGLGVVGQIIPWNFPLLMLSWKLAPALACGNTVVLKPASSTPLTAMLLTEIFDEIGLPKGVVNIVNGRGGEVGEAIIDHEDVKKIAFTGSTSVGSSIQKRLAGSTKRLTLELGGKGAHIVFEGAPIDQAVEGVVQGIYFNQGEVCCAGSRLLVQESIVDVFFAKLKERVKKLRVGNPLDYNTEMGAINSEQQYNKIKKMIQCGIDEGATLHEAPVKLPEEGYFIAPTFFTDVAPNHTIAIEEIFGPVLSVMTFRTPDEAVAIANNTRYGLGNGLWSQNPELILEMGRRLESGVVWANSYNVFDPTSPFGGVKYSGFGREGGVQGLLPYLQLQ